MSTVEKITAADLEGKGVTPLPDVPEMTSEQLKYKFEEIVRDVAIAKINEIIDAIYAGGLPVATSNAIGGVKAAPAESSDVQPVRIGEDGVLYTGGAVQSVNGQTGAVVLNAEDVGALPDDTDIPTALADLEEDATHRTVTDTQAAEWDAKQDAIPDETYDDYGAAETAVTEHNSSADAHESLFAGKADAATTYTKTEVDAALAEKQNVIPSNTFDVYGSAASVQSNLNTHTGNNDIHVTAAKKAEWDAKQNEIPANTYDAYGSAASVQTNLDTVTAKIPIQATAQNQLADKNFVNSSIENTAAYFITKNATGDPFATKAELNAATVFYSGGVVRVPIRNDYTVVLADESKTISATGENPTTRYLYDNGWQYQYIVNNSGLTAAQLAAVNSGVTATKVDAYDSHVANNNIHVTSAQKAEWDAKQSAISDLATIRSGAALGATAVQPVSGKGLSSNDYTTTEKNKLAGIATGATAVSESTVSGWGFTKNAGTYSKPSSGIPKTDLASAVQTSLGKADNSVQTVSGKGLSSNDYTTAEKNKLAGIATGATANVGTITKIQLAGTDLATSGAANIPAATSSAYGVTKVGASGGAAAYSHSHGVASTSSAGFMSATDKTKLDSITPLNVYTTYTSGSTVTDNSLYEITASTAFTIALGSVNIVRGVHFVVTTSSAIKLTGITASTTLKINDLDGWLKTASGVGDVYEVSILKDVVLIKRTYKAV